MTLPPPATCLRGENLTRSDSVPLVFLEALQSVHSGLKPSGGHS